MRLNRSGTILTLGLAALFSALPGCDRSPKPISSVPPEDVAAQQQAAAAAAATRPSPPSLVDTGASPLPTLRARAEGGDVSAMVALGRAYESLGSVSQARPWYEKAAKTGDATANEALRMMDAAAIAATRPAEQPKLAAAPTTATVVATTARSVDPNHVKWDDIMNSFDNHDFVTAVQPAYRKAPTDAPVFVGVSAAPDKTMIASASGPSGTEIDGIKVAIRVRNRQDLADNKRVQQVASITNAITAGNVTKVEFTEWVSKYLMSGEKSEPYFRNGWSITISGTQGEKINDSKGYLGEMVLFVMKK